MITTRLVGGTKLCPKSNEGRCEALCSEAMGTEATSRGNYSTRRSSVAAVAIAPLQDLLNLGTEARMNIPGSSEGNWSWRTTKEMLDAKFFERLVI